MAAYTGTVGNIVLPEAIYIDGAPVIFFQDYEAPGPLHSPDADGYYWGLSGTSVYPVYQLGCYTDVSFADNLTFNDVRCDTDGNVATIGKRNYLELRMTVQGIMPLAMAARLFNWSDPEESGNYEKAGIGSFSNQRFWRAWLPMVYDEDTGDWLGIQLHRGQFVQNTELSMSYGTPWNAPVVLRGYAAPSPIPANQRFATVIRHDPSALGA